MEEILRQVIGMDRHAKLFIEEAERKRDNWEDLQEQELKKQKKKMEQQLQKTLQEKRENVALRMRIYQEKVEEGTKAKLEEMSSTFKKQKEKLVTDMYQSILS